MIAIPVCPPRPIHRIPAIKPDPLDTSAQETLRRLIEKESHLLDDKARIAGLLDGLAIRERVTRCRLEIVQRNIWALRALVCELEPLPF